MQAEQVLFYQFLILCPGCSREVGGFFAEEGPADYELSTGQALGLIVAKSELRRCPNCGTPLREGTLLRFKASPTQPGPDGTVRVATIPARLADPDDPLEIGDICEFDEHGRLRKVKPRPDSGS